MISRLSLVALPIVAAMLPLNALGQEYRYQPAQTAQAAQSSPPATSGVQQAPAMGQAVQQAPQTVQPAAQAVQAAPVAAPVAPAAAPCGNCGTIDSIRVTEKAGEGSGVGLVAGGVLGGLLGHQIGRGSGNTAATIIGAAGGAYAGHQVEKNVKKASHYEVNVRMDDGAMRTVTYDVEPGFRSGDKVRFIDGKLTRN